jgi:hypothetical protein
MANLAIAIGMLPQIIGGAGAEFRVPMAVVQMGGVLVSMGFTLFVIPVVYTYADRLTATGRRERREHLGRIGEDSANAGDGLAAGDVSPAHA